MAEYFYVLLLFKYFYLLINELYHYLLHICKIINNLAPIKE